MRTSQIELVAERFKALSEPMRLKILNTLRDGEKSVGEVVDRLHIGHANASKHLQLLRQAGFVKRRKEGLHVYYRVADRKVFRLCELMCS